MQQATIKTIFQLSVLLTCGLLIFAFLDKNTIISVLCLIMSVALKLVNDKKQILVSKKRRLIRR